MDEANITLGFEKNNGQMLRTDGSLADNVLFRLRAPGLVDISITDSGLLYQFHAIDKKRIAEKAKAQRYSMADAVRDAL